MKTLSFSVVWLVAFCTISLQTKSQSRETSIAISNALKSETEIHDTTTEGYKSGQLIIYYSRNVKPAYFEIKGDSVHSYQIHFFNMYQNKLKNFQFGYSGETYFDRARYVWMNDTTVSVTMYNSNTKESKNLKLAQIEKNVGIISDEMNK